MIISDRQERPRVRNQPEPVSRELISEPVRQYWTSAAACEYERARGLAAAEPEVTLQKCSSCLRKKNLKNV